MGGLLHGDLGMSYRFQGRSVNDILGGGVWVSISAGRAWPWRVSLLIGIPTAFWLRCARTAWFDRYQHDH